MPRKSVQVTVSNEIGLHARPAAVLVQKANEYESSIFIDKDGHRVNAKSIMGVLTLAAKQGTKLMLHAEGPDAEEALQALVNLFLNGFEQRT